MCVCTDNHRFRCHVTGWRHSRDGRTPPSFIEVVQQSARVPSLPTIQPTFRQARQRARNGDSPSHCPTACGDADSAQASADKDKSSSLRSSLLKARNWFCASKTGSMRSSICSRVFCHCEVRQEPRKRSPRGAPQRENLCHARILAGQRAHGPSARAGV